MPLSRRGAGDDLVPRRRGVPRGPGRRERRPQGAVGHRPVRCPAGRRGEPASGWLVVTVYREPSDVDTAQLPAPPAEHGDRIEVRVRPAADGKGTELGARLRDRPSSGSALGRLSGSDPQADLRSALR